METIRILLLRPDSQDPSPIDQSLGARLSAGMPPADYDLIVREEHFQQDDLGDLERKLYPWEGKISGLVGATHVRQSIQLGRLAERMNLLCFVANNNSAVWKGRRQVFHIGLPTRQTTASVATLIKQTGRRRILLLHDQTEFQARMASSMKVALSAQGMEPRSKAPTPAGEVEIPSDWKPDLVYVIFSNERKAFLMARAIRRQTKESALLFGRSLLRESFLAALGDLHGENWFVDMFHRNALLTESRRDFMQAMAANGVTVPTANHAFGWDGMKFCTLALHAAGGMPAAAIDYLESGVPLEGASGTCSFSPQNHNGRSGTGPTTLTRWHKGQLENV